MAGQVDPNAAAATAKAEAEARKAEAEARQAEAAARSAAAKAQADEADAADANSPLGRAARDAAQRKAAAEAEASAAKARREQVAALIPDFSNIDASKLDVKEDVPLFGAALAQSALGHVATALDHEIQSKLGRDTAMRILVTTDAELATSDSVYLDVKTGLDELNSAAGALLEAVAPPAPGARVPGPAVLAAAPAAAVVGAVASALPGIVSLFSAQRTLTSSAVSVGDLSASAAAAGALARNKAWTVVHDDVRLVPTSGAIQAAVSDVGEHRRDLEALKATLDEQKATAQSAQPPEDTHELERHIARIEGVIAAIDTFMGSLTTVADGAKRSPLALAVLREELHSANGFSHVLFVAATSGSMHEAIDNRPLWFKDKFSIAAAVSLTYILIDTSDSAIVVSGTISRMASGRGTIGGELVMTERM